MDCLQENQADGVENVKEHPVTRCLQSRRKFGNVNDHWVLHTRWGAIRPAVESLRDERRSLVDLFQPAQLTHMVPSDLSFCLSLTLSQAYIQDRALYEMKCRKAAQKSARASERGQQQQQQRRSETGSVPGVSIGSRNSAAGSSTPGLSTEIEARKCTSSAGSAAAESGAAVSESRPRNSGVAGGALGGAVAASTTVSSSSFAAVAAVWEVEPANGSNALPSAQLQRQPQLVANGANGLQQQQQQGQQQLKRAPLPALLLEEQHGRSSSSGRRLGDAPEEGPITPSRVAKYLQPRPVTCDMVQVGAL